MWQAQLATTLAWILPYLLLRLLLLEVAPVRGFRGRPEDPSLPKPKFFRPRDSYTYRRGDLATLHCYVKDLGTKTVTWRRASQVDPLTIGEMVFTQDKDYQMSHKPGSQSWDLQIKNVQMKHAGEYECQISTKDKMKTRMTLEVIDDRPDPEKYINISGSRHIDKGQTIALRCNAGGAASTPGDIDWFKDGNKLMTDIAKGIQITKHISIFNKTISGGLLRRNAQMSDAGTYTCRTSDDLVTSVQVNILDAKKPDSNIRKREEKKLSSLSASGVAGIGPLGPYLPLWLVAIARVLLTYAVR